MVVIWGTTSGDDTSECFLALLREIDDEMSTVNCPFEGKNLPRPHHRVLEGTGKTVEHFCRMKLLLVVSSRSFGAMSILHFM